MAGEGLTDLCPQLGGGPVVTQSGPGGETLGVGAAMALDHDAVETQKYTAIRFARIHLIRERAECATRQDVAEFPRQRTVHLTFEILAELARGSLGALEGNVAGKAFGHHHIDRSFADIVAFDEADIFELRPLAGAQDL